MPGMRSSLEFLQALLSQITPIPMGCVSVLPEDEINDDHPAVTQVHKAARNPDVEDEDENENEDHPTLPAIEDKCGRVDILSKVTKDNQ